MMTIPLLCVILLKVFSLESQALTLDDLNGQGFIEGDLVPPKNRNGILAAKRWTNGVIPWEFSKEGNWGSKHREFVAKVIREIEQYTCIRFVPRTNQVNYVRIINDSYSGACYSSLGQAGGMQDLNLYDSEYASGCWSNQLVMHELLHAVGLGHEHTRYDRENYIKIYMQNVAKRLRSNFEIGWQNETNTYGVPYDYYSIMHYGKNSHTDNGRITMKPTDIKMINVIGRQNSASENDFEKVRRIYECKGSYPKVPAPGPQLPPSEADLNICEDEIDYCEQSLNQCGQDWTKNYCKRSCGFCPKEADCQDELNYCDQLAKTGDCAVTQLTREVYCKKTCKFC